MLNHGILPAGGTRRSSKKSFIDRFVFPDGELLEVGSVVTAIQRAGFEVATSRACASTTR